MLKKITICCLMFACCYSQAQIVKVTDRVKVKIKKRSKQFHQIHPEFPKDSLLYIGTLEGNAKNVEILYEFLKGQTNEMKGNFYEMTHLTQDDGKYKAEWKIYYGSDSLGMVNYNLFPKNEVYFFSDFRKAKIFFLNDERLELPKMAYIKIKLDTNEELRFRTGVSKRTENIIKGVKSNVSLFIGNFDKKISLNDVLLTVLAGGLFGVFGEVVLVYRDKTCRFIQPGSAHFFLEVFKEQTIIILSE
jgi:hypothetical protein